ncbi:hypothetical protein GUJ93_ZPchr0006g44900 [Zizania palustris]|uniref:Uncharacterized protein n=1 Tax=Zizania palustris TaxID=103762 RepID=A0A8J5T995_ZIZPA|nr:hypothetical protein GUJ93_ZPchr0006g44900 [Zizania palustris]
MSKKNNLGKRKKQHEFDLQREKEAKEKLAKKLQAKKSKMKIDGGMKRKGGKFKVGKKKVKTKLSALAKAKAAQAMEVDKFHLALAATSWWKLVTLFINGHCMLFSMKLHVRILYFHIGTVLCTNWDRNLGSSDKMSKLLWHMYNFKLYSIGIIGSLVNSSTYDDVINSWEK